MAFNMFETAVNNGLPTAVPDNWYRGIEQAFIDAQWDNTTTLKDTIQEQIVNWNQDDYFEDFEFKQIEAWVNSVVGQSSTGSKTGRDFLQLIFQDITHPILEGRYYIVDGQYYMSYFDNRVIDVDANLSVRRCNQWMKIIDPMSGAIYQLPCVVDYDMSAPSNKITNSIITPNNHAVVKVQQNAMTDRLFTTNKRFILGGRPFRITGMQNAINQFINNDISSSMDIDLFLDEIWEKDDLLGGLAYNGTYDYVVSIIGEDMNLTNGAVGNLSSTVMLNGAEVERVVNWTSSDENVVTVDDSGQYRVIGEVGSSAEIRATLYHNVDVFDSITITVVDETQATTDIEIDPTITTIREYETITIDVYGIYNGQRIAPDTVNIIVPSGLAMYLSYELNNNQVVFTCNKRYSSIVNITFEVECDEPEFSVSKTVPIKLTSLLG